MPLWITPVTIDGKLLFLIEKSMLGARPKLCHQFFRCWMQVIHIILQLFRVGEMDDQWVVTRSSFDGIDLCYRFRQRALAPKPYTVSVGKATNPPAAKIFAASDNCSSLNFCFHSLSTSFFEDFHTYQHFFGFIHILWINRLSSVDNPVYNFYSQVSLTLSLFLSKNFSKWLSTCCGLLYCDQPIFSR